MGVGGWRAAPLRVGSPAHPRNSPEQISGDPEAERNARARCSGPPVQLRWTTLRVQGPTLRDAALANDGHGSPPVAPLLLHRPLSESGQLPSDPEPSPTEALSEICNYKVWHATQNDPVGLEQLCLNRRTT